MEDTVQAVLRWSPHEVATLVTKVETMDDSGADWQRGGLGQNLWSILVVDPDLSEKLPVAIAVCVEAGEIESAVRLLVCHQYLAEDPGAVVSEALLTHPTLANDEMACLLAQEIQEHGRVSVY